jgi:Tfp pilus assembly protein PilE
MLRNHAGFAAVKLLLVVISIGVIAAIVAPRSSNSGDRTKLVTVRSVVHKAQVAEEEFYSDNARYATLAQLQANGFALPAGVTMKIRSTLSGYTIRASDTTIVSSLKGCVVRVGGVPMSLDGEISCP